MGFFICRYGEIRLASSLHLYLQSYQLKNWLHRSFSGDNANVPSPCFFRKFSSAGLHAELHSPWAGWLSEECLEQTVEVGRRDRCAKVVLCAGRLGDLPRERMVDFGSWQIYVFFSRIYLQWRDWILNHNG